MPAGNRFLNYLSNNFSNATEIGLENADWWLVVEYKGWKITKNFTRSASGYYLTANDASSLNNIFQTISDNIQTADIDLGSQTVVKDTVSGYFDLPTNTSDIRLFTADYDGSSFGPDTPAQGLTPEIKDGTVSVTGFDFNANFVSNTVKEDGT